MKAMMIHNVRLLDPASELDGLGWLLVEDGRITKLALGKPGHHELTDDNVQERIDGGGFCLAPGLVDMRVQPRSREVDAADREIGLQAASGGITSVVCVPSPAVPLDDAAQIRNLARLAEDTSAEDTSAGNTGAKNTIAKNTIAKNTIAGGTRHVNFYCYGALTRKLAGQEMAELGLMREAGALGFTDGTKADASAAMMYRLLSYAKGFDQLVLQHPEEPSLAEGGHMNMGPLATRLGLQPIMPEAEVMMIERDLHLVRRVRGRYHVGHVSTRSAIAAIAAARREGLAVTCDTAPPYFLLNEHDVAQYQTFARLSPPLRSEDDRIAVVEGLSQGVIDAVASDHIGCHLDQKRLPFAAAAIGGAGLETLLALTLSLYHQGRMSLLDAIGLITSRPARLLRIDAGQLAEGARADMVWFDPDASWQIRSRQSTLSPGLGNNTPFDGTPPVQGQVLQSWVGGRCVYRRNA